MPANTVVFQRIDCPFNINLAVDQIDEAVGIDAVIITKYDSTAKGGIAVSVGKDYGIPIAFVCFGESYKDLSLFDKESYLNDFLGQ